MDKKLIFIVGTGRSGTHLVGRVLATNPQIQGRIEEPETFRLITKIAVNQDFKCPVEVYFQKQILKFKLINILKHSTKHILEKSHPSLWLIDFLIENLKNVLFIGILRDIGPTVSSMLEHKGVLSWYNKLPLNKENRFLGITKDNRSYFEKLTIEEKCALRWLSHKNELFRLLLKYPDWLYIVKYEDFIKEPKPILSGIAAFAGVTDTFECDSIHSEALDKWKQKLSKDQIDRIHYIGDIKNVADFCFK